VRDELATDSEVITLMLAQDYIPYPGENQFIGYIKANYPGLFPDLITQYPKGMLREVNSIDVLGPAFAG